MNNILKNLESLRDEIKLSAENKNLVENLIMTKVSQDLAARKVNHISVWLKLADKFVPQSFALQPVAVFGLILGLFFISSFASISAAKNTLPGDTLYPVKITAENLRYTLTFSQDEKAKFAMSMFENRAGELKVIMQGEENGERKDKLVYTTQQMKSNLNQVRNNLKNSKEIATAKEIKDKLAVLQGEINSASQENESGIKNELASLINQVEDTKTVILTVLLNSGETEEEIEISTQELKEEVKYKINKFADKIAELERNSSQYELFVEADKSLKEIEFNFRQGDYKLALENISKLNELLNLDMEEGNVKGESEENVSEELDTSVNEINENDVQEKEIVSELNSFIGEEIRVEAEEFNIGIGN